MTYQDQDTTTPISPKETPASAVFQSQVQPRIAQPAVKPIEVPPTADSVAKTTAAPPEVTRALHPGWLRSWMFIWLGLLLTSGGAVVWAFIFLTALPPPPNCQQPNTVTAEIDRLACAQQAAASGDLKPLVAGVKLVQNWPKDSPRYLTSRRFLANWSASILLIARQKANQNQLPAAIAVANSIPASSPTYPEAQAAIASWQQDLNQGQVIYDRLQAALKAQNWRQATEELQALVRLPNASWRPRLGALRRQLRAERVSRDRLQEARNLAQTGSPELLGQAIALAQTIEPNRYARPEAQAEVGRWSRTLLNLAIRQLGQEDIAGARLLAQKIPFKSALGAEAQEFLRLCRAQEIVTLEAVQLTVDEQWLDLLAAVQIARRLPAGTPLAMQTKTYLPRWEASLQDLSQLQFANSLARLGQIPALQLAMNQASRITPNRPQRLQAQTLISHWRKEIQRIQDRPILEQAATQAQTGNPKQLKAAIAQASQIAKGRALRREAQAAIAQWNRQLQQLEAPPRADRQILAEAEALAEWGNLIAALEQARQIRPASPIYPEAQAAISRWTTQLETTQSRPAAPESR